MKDEQIEAVVALVMTALGVEVAPHCRAEVGPRN